MRDGQPLCQIELSRTPLRRLRGLLGRNALDGALLLSPCNSVHTFGMRFDIDVAFVTRDLVVLDVITMRRQRVSLPRRHCKAVIETAAGVMETWGLAPDQQLDIADGLAATP